MQSLAASTSFFDQLRFRPAVVSPSDGDVIGWDSALQTWKPKPLPDLTPYATNSALSTGLATKEPSIPLGTTFQYWRGDKTWQTLNAATIPDFATKVAEYAPAPDLSPYARLDGATFTGPTNFNADLTASGNLSATAGTIGSTTGYETTDPPPGAAFTPNALIIRNNGRVRAGIGLTNYDYNMQYVATAKHVFRVMNQGQSAAGGEIIAELKAAWQDGEPHCAFYRPVLVGPTTNDGTSQLQVAGPIKAIVTPAQVPLSLNLAASQTANALNITSNGGAAGNLFRVGFNGQTEINLVDPSPATNQVPTLTVWQAPNSVQYPTAPLRLRQKTSNIGVDFTLPHNVGVNGVVIGAPDSISDNNTSGVFLASGAVANDTSDGAVVFGRSGRGDYIRNIVFGNTQAMTRIRGKRVLVNDPTDDTTSVIQANGTVAASAFKALGTPGVGTAIFTTTDGKTVTVTGGIVTSVI